MRLAGLRVEVDGLVAAITAGDVATSASDAKVSVNSGEDLGLAVEVGGAGKTIVPFATSGGSTIKKACEDLQAAYPKYKFGEGKLLNKINKSEIEKWAGAVK